MFLLCKLCDHASHMTRMFEIQIDTDVFIWRVRARVGIAQTRSSHRQAQIMYKWITGTGAADHRDHFHWEFIHLFGSLHYGSDEAVIWIRPSGRFAAQVFDLHIAEAFGIQM